MPRPQAKYSGKLYPYITGSDCYVSPAWPKSIIELFNTG